ncbi:MAG: glycosyltransferase, partial [Firmicutes bacterium]|nr:glycosyltransferase [Bacillota bacterium]
QNLPHEQDFFMQEMLQGRDRWNAAMFVGTNAIFRRTALEAIGGFATNGLTEDVTTGMRLHARGGRSAFIARCVARGMAPESVEEYLHQRTRWAMGNIQALRTDNPLTMPGLSLLQRLIYLSGLTYWFFGWQKMIFLLAPILYPLTGLVSLHAKVPIFLGYFVPPFFGGLMIFTRIANGRTGLFYSLLIEFLSAPRIAGAALVSLLPVSCRRAFRVTQKGLTGRPQSRIVWPAFLPLFVLWLLTIWALIADLMMPGVPSAVSVLVAGWLLFNSIPLSWSLVAAIDYPRPRHFERMPARIPVQIIGDGKVPALDGRLQNFSEQGAQIFLTAMPRRMRPSPLRACLSLPTQGLLVLQGDVVRQTMRPTGEVCIALRWTDIRCDDYRKIVALWLSLKRADAPRLKPTWPLHSIYALGERFRAVLTSRSQDV